MRKPVPMLGNPAHKNPWEVRSDSGLEGVFADEDDARFYAEEIRGSGASGVVVEIRKRPLHPRLQPQAQNPSSRLFAGVYPEGIVYADKARERDGDYLRVAFLPYSTLQLEWSPGVHPPDLRAEIEQDAAKIIARRGQDFPVDASGHTVRLGGKRNSASGQTVRLGNPGHGYSWRQVAGIGGGWNVEQQDKYGTWKVTDRDVSREYAEKTVTWVESKGGTARAVKRNPAMQSVYLSITWGDGDVQHTTLREFCEDNSDDHELCDKARGLRPGESFSSGGGAAPFVIIRRDNPAGYRKGDAVSFDFTIPHPVAGHRGERRTGTGVVASDEVNYSSWPPGFSVRVTSSEDYEPGTIIAVSSHNLRKLNPAGLTAKGERMYQSIKAGYGDDPRAAEIASRTVLARARTTRGLKKR